jgi:hypothetical protein
VVDLRWVGPFWVERVSVPPESTQQFVISTIWGVDATMMAFILIWRFVGRKLWRRAEVCGRGTPITNLSCMASSGLSCSNPSTLQCLPSQFGEPLLMTAFRD